MAGRDLLSLVVTLGNVRPEGKPLSLDKMKLSLLNEEARQNHRESISNLKGLVTEGDSNRGRDQQRSPQNWDKSGTRSKSRRSASCFYCGKPGHFQYNFQHYKGGVDGFEPKKNPKTKGSLAIATREENCCSIRKTS